MAPKKEKTKVTIEVVDKPNGNVGLTITFEPEVKTKGVLTPAQELALRMVTFARRSERDEEEE